MNWYMFFMRMDGGDRRERGSAGRGERDWLFGVILGLGTNQTKQATKTRNRMRQRKKKRKGKGKAKRK